MKIIFLHGDNTVKVSERLTKFIDVAHTRNWKVVRINDKDSAQDFREMLTSTPLFKETKLFILDGVAKVKKTDLEWLKKNNKNLTGTLIIVNQGVLKKTITSLLPKPDKSELFELPKKIWTFMDSLYPKNARLTLNLLHEVLENEPIELIVALMGRQLKDLYVVKRDPKKLDYQPWRVRKLASQSERFSNNTLKELISSLAVLDYEAKIGKSDLTQKLDLIIATQLE